MFQVRPRPQFPLIRYMIHPRVLMVSWGCLFLMALQWQVQVYFDYNNQRQVMQELVVVVSPDSNRDEEQEQEEERQQRRHHVRDNNNNENRLEFVHIPKTGGTMIELLALQNNITWGACHFEFPWRRKAANPLKDCPRPLISVQGQVGGPVPQSSVVTSWHWPLQHLNQSDTSIIDVPNPQLVVDGDNDNDNDNDNHMHFVNPYDSLGLAEKTDQALDRLLEAARKPKKYFAVVRNPYDRYMSLFYHRCFRKQCKSPKFLNSYLQQVLNNTGFKWRIFCQYEFIFDTNTNERLIDDDHIVHFENLKQELEVLANERYGLNLVVPEKPPRNKTSTSSNSNNNTQSQLGLAHVSPETLQMIHDKCDRDFDLGPYKRMI